MLHDVSMERPAVLVTVASGKDFFFFTSVTVSGHGPLVTIKKTYALPGHLGMCQFATEMEKSAFC